MKVWSWFLLILLLVLQAEAAPPEGLPQVDFHDGSAYRVALKKVDASGGVHYYGLIRNSERIVFEGEIKGVTEGFSWVHYAWNDQGLYALLPGGVAKLDLPAGFNHFEFFMPTNEEIKNGGQLTELTLKEAWRGVRASNDKGETKTLWVKLDGEVYSQSENKLLPHLDPPLITVGIPDFEARFREIPLQAIEKESVYELWALTPADKDNLVFDFFELRPVVKPNSPAQMLSSHLAQSQAAPSLTSAAHASEEVKTLQVFTESRAIDRNQSVRSARMLMHAPDYFLARVYERFSKIEGRSAFDEKLMDQIRTEDRLLPKDRMVYLWSRSQNGEIVGGIRLFQGFEHPGFLAKDFRLPIERQYAALKLREKFAGKPLYELNRLIVEKNTAQWLNTKKMVSVLLDYMSAKNLPNGVFIIHTDEVGAKLYKEQFGAEIEMAAAQMPDGTYVLSVTPEKLREKVGSPLRVTNFKFNHPLSWCDRQLSP